MAKTSMIDQMARGARNTDWGNLIPSITRLVRGIFVQMGGALSILTLMGIDIILGGISTYFMFQDVPFISPYWLAAMFSVGLSAVSYRLWLMVRKGTKYDKWLLAVIIFITPLDLWVDLAFMEVVYGTGDVWWFLSPEAFAAVPRPPLWWGFMALIGLITLANEPLTAILTESMAKKDDFKSRYKSSNKVTNYPPAKKQTPNRSTYRQQQKSFTPEPPAPVLNTQRPLPQNMNGMSESDIQKLFFGGKK